MIKNLCFFGTVAILRRSRFCHEKFCGFFSPFLNYGMERMKKIKLNQLFLALLGSSVFFAGCASPGKSESNEISADDDLFNSGISSRDVRTVAFKMTPSILAIPEIAAGNGIKRVKISEFKNSSRFFVDRNLFIKRLTVELNRHGNGRLRFLNNNTQVIQDRMAALKDRQSSQMLKSLKQIAAEIAALPAANQNRPITVAVLPVLNINLVNMNGESFIAMLRSEVSSASNGRVQFLLPGTPVNQADYYLAGQFIPETIKTEGIINLANYIEVVDARVKAGRSMYVTSVVESDVVPGQVTSVTHNSNVTSTTVTPTYEKQKIALYETHIKELLNNPQLRSAPDINKRLNVILADAKTKASIYEKMVLIDRKVTSGIGYADYVISGEISGMYERQNDASTDYLLITVQLTDVETGEMVWEDAYEVKRKVNSAVEYR